MLDLEHQLHAPIHKMHEQTSFVVFVSLVDQNLNLK